jgi:hypothetical protein
MLTWHCFRSWAQIIVSFLHLDIMLPFHFEVHFWHALYKGQISFVYISDNLPVMTVLWLGFFTLCVIFSGDFECLQL